MKKYSRIHKADWNMADFFLHTISVTCNWIYYQFYNMVKHHFWLRNYSTGDDDRPEIIELSELNQDDSPFAFCPPPRTREQEYHSQHYQEYTSSDYPSEEYPVREYRQGYSNEYGHEHDYHQLQFPESEGEGGNNEDSVSEVNLSDGNIPKMKLEEVSDAHLMIVLPYVYQVCNDELFKWHKKQLNLLFYCIYIAFLIKGFLSINFFFLLTGSLQCWCLPKFLVLSSGSHSIYIIFWSIYFVNQRVSMLNYMIQRKGYYP